MVDSLDQCHADKINKFYTNFDKLYSFKKMWKNVLIKIIFILY